jgi:hypothetical protein
MFSFTFADETLFLILGIGSCFLQGCLELSLLLIDPFNILAFLKIHMIIYSLEFVSGSLIEDSLSIFSDNVIDALTSIPLFNLNKCAVSSSHF